MPTDRRSPFAAALLGAVFVWAPAAAGEPEALGSDTRAYNLAHGRVVFRDKCLRCHESGRRGAPVFEDADDWRTRLEQPLDTLIAHAVEGHGDMPARGDQDITNQDVAAAVAYVVDRTRLIVSAEAVDGLPAPAAGPGTKPALRATDEAVVQMFLMLFGKDRWK